MYYIEVKMYGGEIFKYIAGKERDAKFIKTLLDNYNCAVKQRHLQSSMRLISLAGKTKFSQIVYWI